MTTPPTPDGTPEGAQEQPVQPYDTHPPAAGGQPPPVDEEDPWNPPMPSWDLLSVEPEKTDDFEPPEDFATTSEPPEVPATEADDEPPATADPPSPEPEATAVQPAAFAPPPGPPPGSYPPPPPPAGSTSNRRLVIGILAGAAVLLAVLAVGVLLVMRTDEPSAAPSATTSSSPESSAAPQPTDSTTAEATATESVTPPPPGAEGKDGDYAFAVAVTETRDTITSSVGDPAQTVPQGTYYVVYLDVTNTGAAPLSFTAALQQLTAPGQTFPLDEQATASLGGTVVELGPGEQKKAPLVYDVPVGTEPGSIVLRADPSTPGVELPLR